MTDYEHQAFPAWFYGPNGEAEIFQAEEDVPAGWVDHPAKVGKAGWVDHSASETEAPKRGRPKKVVATSETTTEVVEDAEPDEPVEPSEF
jgi:hypothetical protein